MNRIKELRKRFNETQTDLAKILETASSTVSKERYVIPPDVLIKLADHFGVSIDYIVGRTDIKESIDFSFKSIQLVKKLGMENQELSDDSIKKVAEYINFIKQQEKNKK